MASHLGTFHLLFMQWLLFRLSSAFLQPNSNHIKSVDASAETGEWESLCFRKLIPPAPTHFISPKKRKRREWVKAPASFSWASLFCFVYFYDCRQYFLPFLYGETAISALAMALFVATEPKWGSRIFFIMATTFQCCTQCRICLERKEKINSDFVLWSVERVEKSLKGFRTSRNLFK